MQNPSFRLRLRYFFDNIISRGAPAMVGLLFLLIMILVLTAATIISFAGFMQEGEIGRLSFGEAAWESLMRFISPGTMGGDTGTGFRLVMFFITFGGIFTSSMLVAILVSGLEDELSHLRKGRSRILETDHTLILGWSSQVFTILSELMIANENNADARIVILADKDKVEMEDEIRDRVEMRGKTRVICRSGSPNDIYDIQIVNPHAAKSIIVLPPDNHNPDDFVIKTILAITNNPIRLSKPYNIITQIVEPFNLGTLKIVGDKDQIRAVLVDDFIVATIIQSSRQTGLSALYTELLNFLGDNIYFRELPNLVGKKFSDILFCFEDSIIIGIQASNGRISLAPPMNTRISSGDQIIAIAADYEAVRISELSAYPIQTNLIRRRNSSAKLNPQRYFILGWNKQGNKIIRGLDRYSPIGSNVIVVAPRIEGLEMVKAELKDLANLKITLHSGEPTRREILEALNITESEHVIVLPNADLSPQEADSQTITTILHLRDISNAQKYRFTIVSEMLDIRNRQLAEIAQVNDFIVSEDIVSMFFAQISENRDFYFLFMDLLSPEGAKILLNSVTNYVNTSEPINFYTIIEAARRKNEIALGYKLHKDITNPERGYGIILNPKKSALVDFSASDEIIVLVTGRNKLMQQSGVSK